MNGPIAQIVSLGIIAVVALYPSPDKLKSVVDTKPASRVVEKAPANEDAILISTKPPAAPVVVVEAPFDLRCADRPAEQARDVLDACASQLGRFIEAREKAMPSVVPGRPLYPRPEVEEARAALASICRVQWGDRETGDGRMSDSCSVLR